MRQRVGFRNAVRTQVVIGEVSTGCSALSAIGKVIGARPSEAEAFRKPTVGRLLSLCTYSLEWRSVWVY